MERGASVALWAWAPQGHGHCAGRHVGVLGLTHLGVPEGLLGLLRESLSVSTCLSLSSLDHSPPFSPCSLSPTVLLFQTLPCLALMRFLPHPTSQHPLIPHVCCLSSPISLSPCLPSLWWLFPSCPPPTLCPLPRVFLRPFPGTVKASIVPLHFDKPQCCGIRMAFLRWLWAGNGVGGVMRRLGFLGPCWAAPGTQKRGGGLGEVLRMPVLDKGALEALEETEGGLSQHPSSQRPAGPSPAPLPL